MAALSVYRILPVPCSVVQRSVVWHLCCIGSRVQMTCVGLIMLLGRIYDVGLGIGNVRCSAPLLG